MTSQVDLKAATAFILVFWFGVFIIGFGSRCHINPSFSVISFLLKFLLHFIYIELFYSTFSTCKIQMVPSVWKHLGSRENKWFYRISSAILLWLTLVYKNFKRQDTVPSIGNNCLPCQFYIKDSGISTVPSCFTTVFIDILVKCLCIWYLKSLNVYLP